MEEIEAEEEAEEEVVIQAIFADGIERLPEQSRDIMRMRYCQAPIKFREIAAIYGNTKVTIQGIVLKAIAFLRLHLADVVGS